MKNVLCSFLLAIFAVNQVTAGLNIVKSNGITLTGADGIHYIGTSGITLTGADGFLNSNLNGITLTGADGITLTGADGVTSTGVNGISYTGTNGITLTGADGITLTGADGITLTGADGITLTGADGTQHTADSFSFVRPNGITLTGADGITLTGADGITFTGADGISLTGADGITLTGADGITLTGADSVVGYNPSGVVFEQSNPSGITLTGADGITLTGADGITLNGADGITLTGADGITLTGADDNGLQSVDPELAIKLNQATDDSNINAFVVYHQQVNDADIAQLQQLGIVGGTRFRALPFVNVTATRAQLIAVSQLPRVRSLYGNRTLTFDSDPYFNPTGVHRVAADSDLTSQNGSLPVTGRNVTVAVLDTGINSLHPDLTGKVVQNVRLLDPQSLPIGFVYPTPIENLANTDLAGGHGTFVSGIIAASGVSSGGKYSGVAAGSRLLGLSAGDASLVHVLSGFDYLLDRGPAYGVKVVNCSFSANTVFDLNDPVNIATKMLTDSGVNVVFSAGNTGPGNGTLNPYSVAPWVVGVGATDETGALAAFSSRGNFGDRLQHPTLTAPGANVASLRSLPTITGVSGLGGADFQRLTLGEMPFYTTASGTSFSAPQVAAAIALMLEVNPDLSPAQVKDILSRTATPTPKYYYHESGAGMLNTHAAVLEAAFPERRMGAFRSIASKNAVRFETQTSQIFNHNVLPFSAASTNIAIPLHTVQATVSIAWAFGTNDFGLKLYGANNALVGESNMLNLPGLTGRREKIVLRNPTSQQFRSEVRHTLGLGLTQNVLGAVETTRIQYPSLVDLGSLSPDTLADVHYVLGANLMLPNGSRFNPGNSVSRLELAETILRAGLVPQYMTGNRMYSDVVDRRSRGAVESVQSNPVGRLFTDVTVGDRFYPYNPASRLTAAVALVKAANLESQVSSAVLPWTVADASQIPASLRGYVAVAIQNGLLPLDTANRFNPGRALNRIELAHAVAAIVR